MEFFEDVLLCFALLGRSCSVEPLFAGLELMLTARSRGCTDPSKALTGGFLESSTMVSTSLKELQPALGIWRAPDRDGSKWTALTVCLPR